MELRVGRLKAELLIGFFDSFSIIERLHQMAEFRVDVSYRCNGVGDLLAQEFTAALPEPMGSMPAGTSSRLHRLSSTAPVK